jgi:hypothetical protein
MTEADDFIVDATAAYNEPPQRRIRLGTTDEIAVEIARVYRDARSRKVKTEEATRLVYMLYTLAKVKEANLEARLLQMENLLALGRTGR